MSKRERILSEMFDMWSDFSGGAGFFEPPTDASMDGGGYSPVFVDPRMPAAPSADAAVSSDVVRMLKKRGYRANEQNKKAEERGDSLSKFVDETSRMRAKLATYGVEPYFNFADSKFTLSGKTGAANRFLVDSGFKQNPNTLAWNISFSQITDSWKGFVGRLIDALSGGENYSKQNAVRQTMASAPVDNALYDIGLDIRANHKLLQTQAPMFESRSSRRRW
jgi:hypothetical protein